MRKKVQEILAEREARTVSHNLRKARRDGVIRRKDYEDWNRKLQAAEKESDRESLAVVVMSSRLIASQDTQSEGSTDT